MTSSAYVTLSTELRKHGDMKLSDCPKRDLPNIPAGHEEPSTLTGSDLRLAVETGGTAVWTAAGPTVSPRALLTASLPVLQKQTVTQ